MNGITQLALPGLVNLSIYAAIRFWLDARDASGSYERLASLAKKFTLGFGIICLLLANVGLLLLRSR